MLRFIGQPFSEMKEMAGRLGIDIEEGENGECIFLIEDPNEGIDLKFTAEELIAIQLSNIKSIILNRCDQVDFSKVMMTIPSSFNDKQI